MTDSTGSDVTRYVYDPYGTIISQQEQSGLNNPWKFAAGYLDSSTGLYKFGTRYYDPTLGRWTQQDPVGGSLGNLNSANRYVYAGDDPVNLVDPSGRLSLTAACLIAAVVAIVIAIVTLAATLLSGGSDIPFVLTAIAFYLNGGLTVADLTIYGAFLLGCVTGVIGEIVTEAATAYGIL